MAFDRPLEADRVDELSLLSSFVSAPIVGPLLWMLGGHAAAKTQQKKLNAETISSQVEGTQHSCPLTDARSSPVPNADGSDVSDEGDYTMDENDDAMVNAGSTFRKSRKMSWSDESGQNLVEYCDEVSDPEGREGRCLPLAFGFRCQQQLHVAPSFPRILILRSMTNLFGGIEFCQVVDRERHTPNQI